MSTSASTVLTMGDVAARLGAETWQVRRLYERGLLPPASRLGLYRVVDEDDLGAIQEAMVAAGYILAENIGVAV